MFKQIRKNLAVGKTVIYGLLSMTPLLCVAFPALAAGPARATSPKLAAEPTPQSFEKYIEAYKVPQLFDDNNIAFEARLKLLDNVPKGSTAKIMTFVFDNGDVTRRLATHMCKAAKRGVKVQFMPDSKSGDRVDKLDVFDSPHNDVNEEMYQLLANCGVDVRIHNNIPHFDHLPGDLRIPRVPRSWVGWLPGAWADDGIPMMASANAVINASEIISSITDIITKNLEESGFQIKAPEPEAPDLGIVDTVKHVVVEAAKGVYNDLKTAKDIGTSIYYTLAAAKEVHDAEGNFEKQTQALQFLDSQITPLIASTVKMNKAAMEKFAKGVVKDVFANEKLVGLYYGVRYFNRLNHRKLFWVSVPSSNNETSGCMFLGGRNLGDHYLHWEKGHDSFMDGDVVYCSSRKNETDEDVLAQAAASFDALFENKDVSNPKRPEVANVTKYEPRYNYQFKHILFPQANTPEHTELQKIWTPIIDGKKVSVNWSRANILQGQPHPLKREERVLMTPRQWDNPSKAILGQELEDTSHFAVKTATWSVEHDEVRKNLYKAIDNERQAAYIETAYSEINSQFRAKIEQALDRGVDVHIVTNSIFVSDAGSKLIRIVMAYWTNKMLAKYGQEKPGQGHLKIEFATIMGGHMIHFKGAGFRCQVDESGNPYQQFLIGSHNFHQRSGYSDKEHALFWRQPAEKACAEKLGLSGGFKEDVRDMIDMRHEFYAKMAKKDQLGPDVLKEYASLAGEFEDALKSGKLTEYRAKIAKMALRMLYETDAEGNVKYNDRKQPIMRNEALIVELLEKAQELGLGDVIGIVL